MKWKGKTRKQQKCCQVCGYSDTNKLDIHHILSRSLHPNYKSDERNLVCLCPICHEYLHTTIQELLGLAHNECNFKSLILLYAHRGNRKNWNKKKFMRDVLEKAKNGYYDNHLI